MVSPPASVTGMKNVHRSVTGCLYNPILSLSEDISSNCVSWRSSSSKHSSAFSSSISFFFSGL